MRKRVVLQKPFGSVLRDDFCPDSDVLVEFEPRHTVGLNMPDSLSRYFRDRIQAEAEIQSVQAQ